MVQARIVPWANVKELDELKKWFYSDQNGKSSKINTRQRAIDRVKSYQSKGSQYLPHVIDSTAQITSAVLLDEREVQDDDGNDGNISIRLCYTMALIRFVNGILDPTQQSKYAIPLHTLAKKVNLPSWFVDMRHWGTHERELPSLSMLRLVSKEALKWLWDNYWNDDELDDNSDEEGSDVEENNKGVNVKELVENIDQLTSMEELLLEYKWVWESETLNVISSSNFTVNEVELSTQSSKKKLSNDSLSPHELIVKSINKTKKIWKYSTQKQLFIEIFIKNYNPLVFQIMIIKLNGFGIEFVAWLMSTIQDDKKSIILKNKFATWNHIVKKLLKELIENLNMRTVVAKWENWDKLLEDSGSFVSLWISQALLEEFTKFNNANSFKRKRKRKRQDENDQEVGISLKKHIEKLSKLYNENDMKLYDLSAQMCKTQKNSATNLTIKTKETGSSQAMSSILGDLAFLKNRMNNKQKKSSPTLTDNTVTENIVIWKRYENWEPKPFGII